MFSLPLKALEDGLENVTILEAHLSRKIKASKGFRWNGNTTLAACFNSLKVIANALSDSCTKLTLLSSLNPSGTDLESILAEVQQGIEALLVAYFQATQCPLCSEMFRMVTAGVREMVNSIQNLLQLLAAKAEKQRCQNSVGLVWKAAEDIQKLPLSNKAAYRRSWMQRAGEVRDTISEFQGYIDEFRESQEPGNGSSLLGEEETADEGQEADEADEEQEYTPHEASVVEKCVAIMKTVSDLMKLSLQIMTSVADTVDSESGTEPDWSRELVADSKAQFEQSTEDIHLVETNNTRQDEKDRGIADAEKGNIVTLEMTKSMQAKLFCREWVVDLLQSSDNVASLVTDLGVELYPSLDDEKITECINDLAAAGNAMLDLIGLEDYQNLIASALSREMETIRNRISKFV